MHIFGLFYQKDQLEPMSFRSPIRSGMMVCFVGMTAYFVVIAGLTGNLWYYVPPVQFDMPMDTLPNLCLSTRSALSMDRDRKLTVLSTRSALSMDRDCKLTVLSTRSALSVDRDRKLTVLSTRSALSVHRTSMGKVLQG